MNNTAAKILFLGAVLAAVLLSRAIYPPLTGGASSSGSASGAAARGGASAGTASAVPIFVMPQVAVTAMDGKGDVVGKNATATLQAGISVAPPNISAAASLVMNLDTGAVIEASNPNRRWPTASIAKLMSATIVYDKIPTSTDITITQEAFSADPSERHLAIGGRYSVEDLLHAMLMPSSNVAAEANADFYGLGAFVAEMNARAAAWGMADTHYDDPSGISAGDESTAADLTKLAEVIYKRYPSLLGISDTKYYYITDLATGSKTLIQSIDQFAGKPGYVGGKDGFTPQADGNHLAIFQSGGRPPVVVVVLGSSDRFGDSQMLYDWFRATYK